MQKTQAKAVRSDETFPEVGAVVVTKVIREHVPLRKPREGFGESFGQAVDAIIQNALDNGECIQSFEVHIREEHWNEMQRNNPHQPEKGWA